MPDAVSPVLVPAILAGFIWLVSWRLWNRNSTSANGHWGGALAFAGGYVAAYVVMKSWPTFPPVSAEHWIVYFAIIAGIVAAAERWWGAAAWSRWPVMIALTFGLAWFELRSLRIYEWSASGTAAWIAGLVVLTTFVWDQLDRLAKRRPSPTTPAALWVVTTGAAVSFVLSKSAFLGQLSGALSAIFGAAFVLALWGHKLPLNRGAISVFVLVFSGLLWQGRFFSNLPTATAILLLLAPLGLWASEFGEPAEGNPWKIRLARTAAVLIPVVIAVAIAAFYFFQTPKSSYDY